MARYQHPAQQQPFGLGQDEKSRSTFPIEGKPAAQRKMPARRLLFGLLVLFCVAFGLATASVSNGESGNEGGEAQSILGQEDSSLAKLFSSASPEAIHRLLHSYFPDTFKHGVYPSDESAVEALYSSDAALATSLVELAKRQNASSSTDSGTTVSTTVIDSTTAVTTTTKEPTTSPTTQAPTTTTQTTPTTAPTTTQEPTTTQKPTTVAPTTTTATSVVTTPTTTTTKATSNTAASTTTPGTSMTKVTSVRETTTAVVSSTRLTSESPVSSPSSTRMTSSTTAAGTTLSTSKTAVTTTSHASSSTRVSTFTSTRPDGGVTTVYSTEVVPASESTSAPSSTGDSSGNLQLGFAAPNHRAPILGAAMGVVVGAILLV
ncbi:hypothetical protein JX266_004933 [Neoarthrinium moseri]|nr:hypothetical protein JX266_004933 [Neoarthrinium moseri]